jgi:hypothetical protein
MSSIHSRADRSEIRTMTTLDLELQRAANPWAITPDERETVAQAAEILGRHETARRLRETNSRRHRGHLAAVADDPRRPLKAGRDRPILVALPGGEQGVVEATDPAAVAWGRLARSAEHSLLTLALDPSDAGELRALAAAARTAAAPPPAQPA